MVAESGSNDNVAGKHWMVEFIATLSTEEKEYVKDENSSAMFRFGDGAEFRSLKRCNIPIHFF